MEFPIHKEIPIIILNVDLIGKLGDYKVDMALDTGATYVMIPWSVSEKLGYDPAVSKERVNITTASGIVKVPLIIMDAIGIGGKLIVKNIKVAVHDLPPKSRVDGLLGLNYLRNLDISLKFRKGILVIE